MDFPEKLWLELSQARPGTVENVLAHGRGGTGGVFISFQNREPSKMLCNNLEMIIKNYLTCPGTFLPPPNPSCGAAGEISDHLCVWLLPWTAWKNSFMASDVKPGVAALRRKMSWGLLGMSGNSWGSFVWS